MRPLVALTALLALIAATAAAAPAVHLSEQHYRSNAQRGDSLVFPTGGRRLPSADASEALAARCATGRLGASERWQILLLPDGAQQLRRSLATAHLATVVFFNAERNLRVRTPPCAAALAKLRDHVGRQRHERDAVQLERLDADSGGFVVTTRARAAPRLVVQHGVSVPIVHADGAAEARAKQAATERQEAEAQVRARMAAAVSASAFASEFDALAAIATRNGHRALLTAKLRQSYVDEFASASATEDDFAELQRDHLELLLQDERELLLPAAAEEVVEASWSPAFSLHHWELLRQRTDAAARRALAEGWVTMARLWLASSGDVVRGVNCLRRAVQWSPRFVPAYVELSTLLVRHAGNESASCEAMAQLLARLESRSSSSASSSDLASVLAVAFPHCSIVMRVTRLWETRALFRFAVAASVALSLLYLGCVLLSCCSRDQRRRFFWRSRESETAVSAPSSSPAPAAAAGGRSRRTKRE